MQNRNTPPQTDSLVATGKPSGHRVRIVWYFVLCVAASLVPLALEIAHYPALESDGAEVVRALGGLLALAVLTFPAGFVPAVLWWLLIVPGIATPFEGVAALLPVFIALGYMQWFVWIPKFMSRSSKTASHESRGSGVS